MDTPYVSIVVGAVTSTQHLARNRFDGVPLLVSAQQQTAGRGRTGAEWIHADRAVAASLALSPHWPRETWPRLNLVAGLAGRVAAGPRVGLAWPNDLMLGDSKVGGVITESDGSTVVIGFGLNLYWPAPIPGAGALFDTIPGAGALFDTDPGSEETHRRARSWAVDLLGRLDCGPDEWGIDEYRRHSATLGREISWLPDGRGRAVDIASDGGLIVETARGREVLNSGVVHTVREA
jgi:BirA family biotin operon repressor/biotin-[acetyl-CoA-carboxylase] ligase